MAQRHQAVRQVHVFDRNAQSLQMKVLAGEIPTDRGYRALPDRVQYAEHLLAEW